MHVYNWHDAQQFHTSACSKVVHLRALLEEWRKAVLTSPRMPIGPSGAKPATAASASQQRPVNGCPSLYKL
jgi:hypothetical protein